MISGDGGIFIAFSLYFSCFGKKSTKRSRPKGRYDCRCAPFGNPRRLTGRFSNEEPVHSCGWRW